MYKTPGYAGGFIHATNKDHAFTQPLYIAVLRKPHPNPTKAEEEQQPVDERRLPARGEDGVDRWRVLHQAGKRAVERGQRVVDLLLRGVRVGRNRLRRAERILEGGPACVRKIALGDRTQLVDAADQSGAIDRRRVDRRKANLHRRDDRCFKNAAAIAQSASCAIAPGPYCAIIAQGYRVFATCRNRSYTTHPLHLHRRSAIVDSTTGSIA